jgi:hypothetical protein
MSATTTNIAKIGLFLGVLTAAYIFWRQMPFQEEPVSTVQEARVVANNSVSQLEPELEPTVATFIANFYAAYADADKDRLASYFTIDRAPEDVLIYQRLFGDSPETSLFQARNASDRVSGHRVIAAKQFNVGWELEVVEQRINANGQDISEVTTRMGLVPAPSGLGQWLISYYTRLNESGTFNALTSTETE